MVPRKKFTVDLRKEMQKKEYGPRICYVSQDLADFTQLVCDVRDLLHHSLPGNSEMGSHSHSPPCLISLGREGMRWAAGVQILTIYSSTV